MLRYVLTSKKVYLAIVALQMFCTTIPTGREPGVCVKGGFFGGSGLSEAGACLVNPSVVRAGCDPKPEEDTGCEEMSR